MKRFIRLVCLLLVVSSLATIPAYAYPQEASTRASSYLSSYMAYCTMLSSRSLGLSFLVVGTGTMDEIGASTIKLQYSPDKVNWTTAFTYTRENCSSLTDFNTSSHSLNVFCTVPPGQYYRGYVEFYSAKGNGFAERYYYTEII